MTKKGRAYLITFPAHSAVDPRPETPAGYSWPLGSLSGRGISSHSVGRIRAKRRCRPGYPGPPWK